MSIISFDYYSPLYTGLNHITRHQFESLAEVLPELQVGPVEIPDEGLKSVQLPEQILGSATAIAREQAGYQTVGRAYSASSWSFA